MKLEDYWAAFVAISFIYKIIHDEMIIRKLKKKDREERKNRENKVKPNED
ncbi:MAG: hypothetical protein H6577_13405 [Lewinellaceae bacterium]|nr:hypothetical protein [Saprospiraceae bacterium]MCB9339121.1 hypothetical protein [Lewinellaceae bacterium]